MSGSNPERRVNPAWTPGVSGNPAGRPRRGQSIAEAIRRRVDPDRIAQLAEQLAESAESETVRLAALAFLADRTEGRPVSVVDMRAQVAATRELPPLPANWRQMSTHDRAAWLDATAAGLPLPALTAGAAGVIDVGDDEIVR